MSSDRISTWPIEDVDPRASHEQNSEADANVKQGDTVEFGLRPRAINGESASTADTAVSKPTLEQCDDDYLRRQRTRTDRWFTVLTW